MAGIRNRLRMPRDFNPNAIPSFVQAIGEDGYQEWVATSIQWAGSNTAGEQPLLAYLKDSFRTEHRQAADVALQLNLLSYTGWCLYVLRAWSRPHPWKSFRARLSHLRPLLSFESNLFYAITWPWFLLGLLLALPALVFAISAGCWVRMMSPWPRAQNILQIAFEGMLSFMLAPLYLINIPLMLIRIAIRGLEHYPYLIKQEQQWLLMVLGLFISNAFAGLAFGLAVLACFPGLTWGVCLVTPVVSMLIGCLVHAAWLGYWKPKSTYAGLTHAKKSLAMYSLLSIVFFSILIPMMSAVDWMQAHAVFWMNHAPMGLLVVGAGLALMMVWQLAWSIMASWGQEDATCFVLSRSEESRSARFIVPPPASAPMTAHRSDAVEAFGIDTGSFAGFHN